MSEETLTRRTVRGITWAYLQTAVSAGLQLAMAGVMARLIDPTAFGLLALANLSLRFVNYFARGGITRAVIHKRDLDTLDIRAATTASVGLGLVFTAFVWAAAPLTERIFDTSDVVPVVRWMALSLLLTAIGATATSLLQRELRFRALAIREIISYVVGYVGVGWFLARNGAGVWALVAAMLTQVTLLSILAIVAHPHPARPTADPAPYRALLSFGGRISIIGFLEFLGANVDTFAVGRYAGPSVLGLYNRANLLADVPTQYLGTSLSKVLFPAFSSFADDVPRVRTTYLSGVRVMAAIMLPTAAGMIVAAPEIILVVLGDDWRGAIPVLPWLAASAGVSMVNHLGAVVVEAQAALNAKIVITLTKIGVLVTLLLVAIGRTPAWYAAALLAANVVAHLAYIRLVRRTLETDYATLLGVYLGPLVTALATAGAIAAVRWSSLEADVPRAVVLVLEVLTGLVVVGLMAVGGPLRDVREDIAARLANAGLDPRATGPLGIFARLLGVPRPVPRPTVGRATANLEPTPRDVPDDHGEGST